MRYEDGPYVAHFLNFTLKLYLIGMCFGEVQSANIVKTRDIGLCLQKLMTTYTVGRTYVSN